MPTFIDESGDTGPVAMSEKLYFHLTAVRVSSYDEAKAFRERVRRLRRAIGPLDSYEFKFASTHRHPGRREAFFDAAMAMEFRFAVVSIDKAAHPWRSADRSSWHRACSTELAASMRPQHELMLAEAQSKHAREAMIVDDNSVERVIFRNSDSDEMLQLAVMI